MPRVYVTQEPTSVEGDRKIDLTPALDYGKLIFVMPPDSKPPLDTRATIEIMREIMKDFNKNDYLLATGHPSFIAWAAIIAIEQTDGPLNMLIWTRGQYRPITADFTFPEDAE